MTESQYKTFENENENENDDVIQNYEEQINEENSNEEDNGCYRCENKIYRIQPKYTISVACATWGFLTGVERAIILPTLWLYFVTRFGNEVAKTYYGSTLAAFNLAVFLFAPLYGYLAYKGFRTKALLVISNQMEIVGNIIYFAASEPWLIMLGRFIAGIGSGSEVPLYADVVRVTSCEERTTYIIILLLARQVGLIIGPAATLILHPVKFSMGNINLNIYNSPGFLMAILWALQTIQVLVSYPDVTKSGKIVKTSSEIQNLHRLIGTIYDSSETAALRTNRNNISCWNKFQQFLTGLKNYYHYNTLTLLLIVFTSYFCLISMEAVMPPVTIRYFKWTEVQNSYLYLVAGIMVIIIFVILQKVSQYVKDRSIILIGIILAIISYVWMTFCLFFVNSDQQILYIVLMCISAVFHVFALSLVIACGESLFTKAVPKADMDMAQSILRTTINFSLLVGPFISGSLQMIPYIVFITLTVFNVICFFLMIFKYHLFDISTV